MGQNSTHRFTTRVNDYVLYRPSYPVELLDLLADHAALTPESIIADIGSGTGLLTELFLENGNTVIGVEPNAEMRLAGEEFLADFARFKSIDGTAEATKLPHEAIDIVIAAQAFHWFDREKTRAEFMRILKPEGCCVLLWNVRRIASSPFMRDYEAMLVADYPEYTKVYHKNVQRPEIFEAFYAGNAYGNAGGKYEQATLANAQHFDLPGLIGHVASASYVPERNAPEFPALVKKLTALFKLHAVNNQVTFEYDTLIYFGAMR